MRKVLLWMPLLFIPLLGAAAEPPPYDMAATPEATTIRQHALNRCRAAAAATMRAQIDCSLAAHRAYAVATMAPNNVTTVFGAMMQNPTGVRGWPSDA